MTSGPRPVCMGLPRLWRVCRCVCVVAGVEQRWARGGVQVGEGREGNVTGCSGARGRRGQLGAQAASDLESPRSLVQTSASARASTHGNLFAQHPHKAQRRG